MNAALNILVNSIIVYRNTELLLQSVQVGTTRTEEEKVKKIHSDTVGSASMKVMYCKHGCRLQQLNREKKKKKKKKQAQKCFLGFQLCKNYHWNGAPEICHLALILHAQP